jgi:hypothetical protein
MLVSLNRTLMPNPPPGERKTKRVKRSGQSPRRLLPPRPQSRCHYAPRRHRRRRRRSRLRRRDVVLRGVPERSLRHRRGGLARALPEGRGVGARRAPRGGPRGRRPRPRRRAQRRAPRGVRRALGGRGRVPPVECGVRARAAALRRRAPGLQPPRLRRRTARQDQWRMYPVSIRITFPSTQFSAIDLIIVLSSQHCGHVDADVHTLRFS